MRYTIVGTGTQAIGQAGKPKGLQGDHWITLPVMWFLGVLKVRSDAVSPCRSVLFLV